MTPQKANKKRISRNKGKNNPFYEKHHSEESKKKMSEAHKGLHSSPKTEFKKGQVPWNKGKKGVMPTPWNKGKKELQIAWNKEKTASKESKRKMSESQKKLWTSEKHRKRMSESAKASINVGRFRKGHKFSEKIKQKIREYTLKQYESGDFPNQTNTKIERLIKKELKKRRYKEGTDFIHQYKFKNKFMCDFCFPKQKVIVEAYGDFWHCNPKKYLIPIHKHQIKGIKRDKSKEAYIKKVDNHTWTYIILWESDIEKNINSCINTIEKELKWKCYHKKRIKE